MAGGLAVGEGAAVGGGGGWSKHVWAERGGKREVGVVFFGAASAGKSTIMGHLLIKCGALSLRDMKRTEKDAAAAGFPESSLAMLVDRRKDERAVGKTMHGNLWPLYTMHRALSLHDSPGLPKFVKRTLAIMSRASVGYLVVAATSILADLPLIRDALVSARGMGIQELVVVVNRMDEVEYAEATFLDAVREVGPIASRSGFLLPSSFKFNDEEEEWEFDKAKFLAESVAVDKRRGVVHFVPLLGLAGENLLESSVSMKWWRGPTLLSLLDSSKTPDIPAFGFRMPVAKVHQIGGIGTVACGTVASGLVGGDARIVSAPEPHRATVRSLESFHCAIPDALFALPIGVWLRGESAADIKEGHVLSEDSKDERVVAACESFTAEITKAILPRGMDHHRFERGYTPLMFIHVTSVPVKVVSITARAERDRPFVEVDEHDPRRPFLSGQRLRIVCVPQKPVALEAADDCPMLGNFVLRDNGITFATGKVTSVTKSFPQPE